MQMNWSWSSTRVKFYWAPIVHLPLPTIDFDQKLRSPHGHQAPSTWTSSRETDAKHYLQVVASASCGTSCRLQGVRDSAEGPCLWRELSQPSPARPLTVLYSVLATVSLKKSVPKCGQLPKEPQYEGRSAKAPLQPLRRHHPLA